jgi:hypothetical protein
VSRHFNDLDAVLESDASNDFRQLVFSLQSPRGFRGSGYKLEHHELGGRCRQGSLRPHRPMTVCSEHASRSDLTCADGPSARLGSRRRQAELRGPWSEAVARRRPNRSRRAANAARRHSGLIFCLRPYTDAPIKMRSSFPLRHCVSQQRKRLFKTWGACCVASVVPKPHHHEIVRRNH